MYAKTFSKLEKCTVDMTSKFAQECRPYKGCPRGPRGSYGVNYAGNKEDIKDILLRSGEYIVKGAGEDFVCIPQTDYEAILRMLDSKKCE